MTTLEPGASEVFTHGLLARPASTALRASSAAATITDGLEVLVQEVMEAMVTAPWSSTNEVPSAIVTGTAWLGRPPSTPVEGYSTGGSTGSRAPLPGAGESLAGKDSADASSEAETMPPARARAPLTASTGSPPAAGPAAVPPLGAALT